MSGSPDCRRREDGSATLLVLAATGVLMFLGLALGVVAAIVVAHRTAQAAADLAALAAASAGATGEACASAERIARANASSLSSCQRDGAVVTVTVRVDGPTLLHRDYDITAQARAGPAGQPR